MNARVRAVLGFLVTLVLLYLAFRDVDLESVLQTMARANLGLVALATTCTLIGYLLRARRWQSILAPAKRVPFPTLFSTLILGFAANNVLPARVGEIIRAYQIGRRANISRSLCFSTILVERVFDGLTLIGFMALVIAFFPIPDRDELRAVEIIGPVIFLGALAVIILLLTQEELANRLIRFALRPLPSAFAERISYLFERMIHGLHALRSPRHLTAILLFSTLVWSMEATSYFLVLLALDVPLSDSSRVSAALFLVVFVNLGIMIPSAPGYVGTFQLFAKIALGAFGVGSVLALSVALLAHALQYLLVTGLGLIVFLREQVPLGQLASPLSPVRGDPVLGESTTE